MKQEDNKEFNAAYDLIHQNSIKIPDKIAFIDDDQTINYSNFSKKVKSFSNQIFFHHKQKYLYMSYHLIQKQHI